MSQEHTQALLKDLIACCSRNNQRFFYECLAQLAYLAQLGVSRGFQRGALRAHIAYIGAHLGWHRKTFPDIPPAESTFTTFTMFTRLPIIGLVVDLQGMTQEAIAKVFGVGQQTVSDWLTTNTGAGISCIPDARTKIGKGEAAPALRQPLAEVELLAWFEVEDVAEEVF